MSKGKGAPGRDGWRMSPLLFSVSSAALLAVLTAALLRRPDLVVLTSPLLAYTVVALVTRPRRLPQVTGRLANRTVYEGDRTEIGVRVEDIDPEARYLITRQPPVESVDQDPPDGVVVEVLDRGVEQRTARLGLGAERWGNRDIPPVAVGLASELGAWRAPIQQTVASRLKVLPLRDQFTSTGATPRPAGMVGQHTSRRPGDKGELADVRPFRPGDRLRRINWRVTSRMQELHVNATWSERDTEVQLVIDSTLDLKPTGSQDDPSIATSLDITMRATAAIAQHYLHRGDRVSMVDLGSQGRDVPAGNGHKQLRRILDVLVQAAPARDTMVRTSPLRPGSLIITLTPLLDESVMESIGSSARQGNAVIVIDTLPSALADVAAMDALNPARIRAIMRDEGSDPRLAARAWQLRRLERQELVATLAELGVPVVAWRGPGTLDEVLRDVSRMAAAPRLVR